MGRKRIKPKIRKKCRKCGELLVNEPEYGVVCPKCGWSKISWTTKERSEANSDKGFTERKVWEE